MTRANKPTLFSSLLRDRYWALAIILTLIVWAGLALAMRPLRDADGSYASYPYGLTTGLENRALDLLFQLRDVRHPDLRVRGQLEPITIIEIDEASIKASNVRLQKWPRDWYAQLVDRASVEGASVIGLDTFLSEAGGATPEDKAADQVLAKSISDAGNVVIAMKTAAGGFDEINLCRCLPMRHTRLVLWMCRSTRTASCEARNCFRPAADRIRNLVSRPELPRAIWQPGRQKELNRNL